MSTFFDPTLVARASKAGFNVIDNAVYTPAVQTMYINAIEQEMSKDRPFPEGYGLEDLIFWEPGNRVLDWPFILHSAGHYSPYSDKQNLLTNGSTQNRFLIADSSGYQFSSNSLQFKEFKDKSKKWTPLEALQAWDSSLKEKEFLLYWMDVDGNRELIYEGVNNVFHAMPLVARQKPPVVADRVAWPSPQRTVSGRQPEPGAPRPPQTSM